MSELINLFFSGDNLLNGLVDKNLIVWTGTTKSDNYGKYIIKNNL